MDWILLIVLLVITASCIFVFIKHKKKKEIQKKIPQSVFHWESIKSNVVKASESIFYWESIKNNITKSVRISGEFITTTRYIYYKPLIDDPSQIGFKPSEGLFRYYISIIKDNYPYNINDESILKGCEKEISFLFEDAGISEKPSINVYSIKKNFISQLIKKYGKQISPDLLVFASISGLLRGTDDPYSRMCKLLEVDGRSVEINSDVVFDRLVMDKLKKQPGKLGFDIKLNPGKNRLVCLDVYEGSPCEKAGILPGDVIDSINGKKTNEMTSDELCFLIPGAIGTNISLSVVRKGYDKTLNFNVVRDKSGTLSNPFTVKKMDEDIGYIRVRRFVVTEGLNDRDSFDSILADLKTKHISSLIIDMRNTGNGIFDMLSRNPNCLPILQQIIEDFLSRLIPSNKVIFKTLTRKGIKEYVNKTTNEVLDIPLVVLVNQNTAGFFEVAAGAIQDNKIGILIGEHTFGKGLFFQRLYSLFKKSNYMFYLTSCYILTPGGKNTAKTSLVPDILVEMNPDCVGKQNDIQLEEAKNYLRKNKLKPHN